jgi:Phosphomannose isomerase
MDDESRRLYPLRFLDEKESKPWGQIVYHTADLGFRESMISEGWLGGSTLADLMETYLERVVGDDVFEAYGTQFPVMAKILDVKGRMPLQVSAGDDVAFERYDSLGKAALWYVLEAGPDAVLYLGFNRSMDAGELYSRCTGNTLEDCLNVVHPHAGEAYFVKPGTVFAAGGGVKLVEIAESSELSFSIFNWGKPLPEGEDLFLEEALDVIDYSKTEPVATEGTILAAGPEFKVTKLDLSAAIRISSDQPVSFALYTCTKGLVSIQVPDEPGSKKMTEYALAAEHSILVPSEILEFYLVPLAAGTVVLETMVEKQVHIDAYTGMEEGQAVDPVDSSDTPDPHIRTW